MLQVEAGGFFSSVPDLFIRPVVGPDDAVLTNPIMGPARKAPAAHGWIQGYALSIVAEFPSGDLEWGHHFISTSAGAEMDYGGELHGNIENSLLKWLGNRNHKFWFKDFGHVHGVSALIN